MKNKSIVKYIIFSAIGFIVMAAGAVLGKLTRDSQGIFQTLPYIFIGIGAGVFGQNLGTVFNIRAARNNPKLAKQKEIEEKDERNISIRYRAKARAYDLMVMVFGALMMLFAMLEVNWTVVVAIVIAYLFIIFSNVYFINKYNKEM